MHHTLPPRDEHHDTLIVVPTCAEPDTVVATFRRLARVLAADGERAHVVLAVNPVRPGPAAEAVALCRTAWTHADPSSCSLTVAEWPGPLGFARAVNLGLQAGLARGTPGLVVLLNDDVEVTPGWLAGLRRALHPEQVRCWSEIPGGDGRRPPRDPARYGRIGLVGPAMHYCAGLQNVDLDPQVLAAMDADLDGFAAAFRRADPGNCFTADFLTGAVLGASRDALADLVRWVPDDGGPHPMDGAPEEGEGPWRPCLLDERFGTGGYEDNDLCVRAELAGWRCAVAGDTFVRHHAHQTSDRHFPAIQRGMANRLVYYDKWAGHPATSGRRLVAAYRVRFSFAQDIHFLRASVRRMAQVCDGVAVLVTANPLEAQQAYDWPQVAGSLSRADHEFLHACSGAGPEEVARATRAWLEGLCAADQTPGTRAPDVVVETWTGEVWNERDERNRAIALAESLGADWVISVDHDEVLEDRVTRAHFDRWMSHPDPLVRAWDVAWVTHWDTPRLQRIDPPWADGDRYASEMHGFRLWRVCRAAPRRILYGTENGLHCGNSPDHEVTAKRVSGLRWRHMGLLRAGDRRLKIERYNRLDPSPDWRLTGNEYGYDHLALEEGMMIAPFVPQNGVGLYMLVHAGESWQDVARWLDDLYGVCDRVVLVWTDREVEAPTPEVARVAELFGATWVRHRVDDDLAAGRNAGLDALRGAPYLGWGLALDPDESADRPFDFAVAVRRMAEVSDSWAWMFEFVNRRPAASCEPPTLSENLRMTRLDPDGIMRWSGRVHEGFADAIERMRAQRVRLQVRYCHWKLHNRGLSIDDDAMQAKIERYSAMLAQELREHPDNCGAWVSLGLQYANDGRLDDAMACMERGVVVAQKSYLPFKELGLTYLRRAGALLLAADDRIPPNHHWKQVCRQGIEFLRQYAPPQMLVGHAHRGEPRPERCPDLPPFPDALVPAAPANGRGPPTDGSGGGASTVEIDLTAPSRAGADGSGPGRLTP